MNTSLTGLFLIFEFEDDGNVTEVRSSMNCSTRREHHSCEMIYSRNRAGKYDCGQYYAENKKTGNITKATLHRCKKI